MPKKGEVKELTTEVIVFKAVGDLKKTVKDLQDLAVKPTPVNLEPIEGLVNQIKDCLDNFVGVTTKAVEDLQKGVADLNAAFVNFVAKPQVVVQPQVNAETPKPNGTTKGQVFQALRNFGVDQSNLSVEGETGTLIAKTGYIKDQDLYKKVSTYLKGKGFTFKSDGKNSRWLQ